MKAQSLIMKAGLVILVSFGFYACSLSSQDVLNSPVTGSSNILASDSAGEDSINYCINNNDSNEKIINHFFKNLSKEHIRPIINLFSRDIEIVVNGKTGDTPFAGVYIGKQQAEKYLKDFLCSVRVKDLQIQFYLSDNDYLNAHINLIAFVPATGKTFNLEFIYSFRLNQKKEIESLSIFYDTYAFSQAFIAGGALQISDRKSASDNNAVLAVSFDSESVLKDWYNYLFTLGDVPAALSYLNENAEFVFKGPDEIPLSGTYYGTAGFLQLLTIYGTALKSISISYDNYVHEGNRADIAISEETMVVSTGKIFKIRTMHSVAFNEEGKVIFWKSYNDSKEMFDKF